MQISESEEGNFHIIKVFGDLDAASSIDLDQTLDQAVKAGKKNILVDCAHLDYISSAGLGVFVSHIEDFKEKDICFALFGMNDKVKNVFEILGLNELLTIVDSKEEVKCK